MKKRFLRALAVLLMACLGVGVLAACVDDPEEPKDPENPENPTPPAVADPIEGVWSDGTGNIKDATFAIKVDGNTAHVVEKMDLSFGDATSFLYLYIPLTKGADGSFSASGAVGTSTTFKVNEENKLVMTAKQGDSEPVSETLLTKTALPATLNITGTQYATYMGDVVAISFGTTPSITYGDEALTEVKLVDVGGYKVITAKYDTDSVSVIVFEEGTAKKACIALNNSMMNAAVVELSSTPAPAAE